MLNPETLEYLDAAKLLPQLSATEIAATAFLESEDYYQKSAQYTGPRAAIGDIDGQRYIETSFVALAKLGELARRYVAGAVGQEPAFETIDEDATEKSKPSQVKIDADALMGAWFDRERMAETTELFAARLVSSLQGYFHFGVPPGLVRDVETTDGIVQSVRAQDISEALEMIYCEAPAPGTAFVYIDPSTRQEYGVYSYSETVGPDKKTVKCIELSWCPTRDENGVKLNTILTNVRILKDDKSATQQFTLDTGGVPLVVGAAFHPLVFSALASDVNIRLNNAINAVATMVKINADVAGFPEKNHVDIEPPVSDTGRKDENNNSIYEDADVVTGPRTAPFHMSVVDESRGSNGEIARSARGGTIIYRAPVSSKPLLEVIRFYLRALYESANQAHILESVAADSSGVARVEARADFARALLKIARRVESALRDVLRGVRCLAAYLSQDRLEEMKALRDNVTCHPNSGPLTSDEKRLIIEMVAAEIISHELAMTMLGVEDIEAELTKINDERISRDFGEPVMSNAKTN